MISESKVKLYPDPFVKRHGKHEWKECQCI